MKSAATLKDLVKLPFTQNPLGTVNMGNGIFVNSIFQNKSLPEEEADDVRRCYKNFIFAAINEKWERDYGEPLRWVRKWLNPERRETTTDYYECPKCTTTIFDQDEREYNCCKCGQRLLPPERETDA